MLYLWVGVAGGVGAILRFALSRAVLQAGWLAFPYATITVNILGSFLIGYFAFALQSKWGVSQDLKVVLVTGLLGGFTTFSAFSLETLSMIELGQFSKALTYIATTLIMCIGF